MVHLIATAVDGAFNAKNETFNFTASHLPDGTYLFEVIASDTLVNWGYANDTLTIDATPPGILTYAIPNNTTVNHLTEVELGAWVVDPAPGTGVQSVYVNASEIGCDNMVNLTDPDGDDIYNAKINVSHEVQNTTTFYLPIIAIDNVSNENNATINFTIYRLEPEVTVDDPVLTKGSGTFAWFNITNPSGVDVTGEYSFVITREDNTTLKVADKVPITIHSNTTVNPVYLYYRVQGEDFYINATDAEGNPINETEYGPFTFGDNATTQNMTLYGTIEYNGVSDNDTEYIDLINIANPNIADITDFMVINPSNASENVTEPPYKAYPWDIITYNVSLTNPSNLSSITYDVEIWEDGIHLLYFNKTVPADETVNVPSGITPLSVGDHNLTLKVYKSGVPLSNITLIQGYEVVIPTVELCIVNNNTGEVDCIGGDESFYCDKYVDINAVPGDEIVIMYNVTNPGNYTIGNDIGEPQGYLGYVEYDPEGGQVTANDMKINIPVGTHIYNQTYTIPTTAWAGVYSFYVEFGVSGGYYSNDTTFYADVDQVRLGNLSIEIEPVDANNTKVSFNVTRVGTFENEYGNEMVFMPMVKAGTSTYNGTLFSLDTGNSRIVNVTIPSTKKFDVAYVDVYLRDAQGKLSDYSVGRCVHGDDYLRETVPPEIYNLQPPNGTNPCVGRRPTISANYADAGSGIDVDSVLIIVDGVNVTANATTIVTDSYVSYTPTEDLSEGTHNVTVEVSDKAGNGNSTSWTFTIEYLIYLDEDELIVDGSTMVRITAPDWANYTANLTLSNSNDELAPPTNLSIRPDGTNETTLTVSNETHAGDITVKIINASGYTMCTDTVAYTVGELDLDITTTKYVLTKGTGTLAEFKIENPTDQAVRDVKVYFDICTPTGTHTTIANWEPLAVISGHITVIPYEVTYEVQGKEISVKVVNSSGGVVEEYGPFSIGEKAVTGAPFTFIGEIRYHSESQKDDDSELVDLVTLKESASDAASITDFKSIDPNGNEYTGTPYIAFPWDNITYNVTLRNPSARTPEEKYQITYHVIIEDPVNFNESDITLNASEIRNVTMTIPANELNEGNYTIHVEVSSGSAELILDQEFEVVLPHAAFSIDVNGETGNFTNTKRSSTADKSIITVTYTINNPGRYTVGDNENEPSGNLLFRVVSPEGYVIKSDQSMLLIPNETKTYTKTYTVPVTAELGIYDVEAGFSVGEYRGGPLNVALDIDRSGSMCGQKLADAKTGAEVFVDQIGASDKAAVVSFADDVAINSNLTSDKVLLKSVINNLVCGGGTNMYDSIVVSVDEIKDASGNKAIIILTDGVSSAYQYNLSSATAYAKANNIPVYTIGLGSDVDESALGYIANETGGEYYFAPTSEELAGIYSEIAVMLIAGDRASFEVDVDEVTVNDQSIEPDPVMEGKCVNVSFNVTRVGPTFANEFGNDLLFVPLAVVDEEEVITLVGHVKDTTTDEAVIHVLSSDDPEIERSTDITVEFHFDIPDWLAVDDRAGFAIVEEDGDYVVKAVTEDVITLAPNEAEIKSVTVVVPSDDVGYHRVNAFVDVYLNNTRGDIEPYSVGANAHGDDYLIGSFNTTPKNIFATGIIVYSDRNVTMHSMGVLAVHHGDNLTCKVNLENFNPEDTCTETLTLGVYLVVPFEYCEGDDETIPVITKNRKVTLAKKENDTETFELVIPPDIQDGLYLIRVWTHDEGVLTPNDIAEWMSKVGPSDNSTELLIGFGEVVITDVRARPEIVNPKGFVTIDVTVKNIGELPTTDELEEKLYPLIVNVSSEETTTIHAKSIGELYPGQTKTISLIFFNTEKEEVGVYNVSAVVDSQSYGYAGFQYICAGKNRILESYPPNADDFIRGKIYPGPNGKLETSPVGDDYMDCEYDCCNETCIEYIDPGENDILNTLPKRDDVIKGKVFSGPNDVLDTTPKGDDRRKFLSPEYEVGMASTTTPTWETNFRVASMSVVPSPETVIVGDETDITIAVTYWNGTKVADANVNLTGAGVSAVNTTNATGIAAFKKVNATETGWIEVMATKNDDYGFASIKARPAVVHPADTNEDGKISDFELLAYIDKWAQGLVNDFDLLEAIDIWAQS